VIPNPVGTAVYFRKLMPSSPLRARTRKMRGICRTGRYAIAYVLPPRHSGSTLRPLHGVCLRTRRARAYGSGVADATSFTCRLRRWHPPC
jgi:hypothetical protein